MARILITGSTSGIGLAAASRLAKNPNELILHGPEPEAVAATALAQVAGGAHPDTRVCYVSADFADPDQVDALAQSLLALSGRLDVLVNNAAIPGPPSRRLGPAGTDLTYQVNYLAGVQLTHLLLPALEPRGRVVNVASATHYSALLGLEDIAFAKRPYTPSAAYAQSKLAIVAYSNWLADHVSQSVVSIHPGVVSTDLLHAMFTVNGIPPAVGGENLAAATAVSVPSGTYLDETKPSASSAESRDPNLQRALVDDTARRLAVSLP